MVGLEAGEEATGRGPRAANKLGFKQPNSRFGPLLKYGTHGSALVDCEAFVSDASGERKPLGRRPTVGIALHLNECAAAIRYFMPHGMERPPSAAKKSDAKSHLCTIDSCRYLRLGVSA